MLHDFIIEHREQITARAAVLSQARHPLLHPESPTEIATFLTQVSTTLRQGKTPSHRKAVSFSSAAPHAGDIRVRNLPGTGCVFTVEIPLVAPGTGPTRAALAN